MQLWGQIPLLDSIVAEVLKKRPDGGRFFLNDDGVFIPDSNEPIAVFQIVPAEEFDFTTSVR
jgi:hypothetical protein